MSSAEKADFISVEAYLELEQSAPTKSEYVDGWIRAMTGASNRHSIVAINTLVALAIQLKGKPCQPFGTDTKVRIQRGGSTWFYYPDVSVVCEENSQLDSFQQRPVLVVEVLSKSTRATDLDEKLSNYLTLPSLLACLLLEQALPRAILLRRSGSGFLREIHEGLDQVIGLPEIGCHLKLAEVYDRVDFSPEAVREELPEYAA